jgi:PPOX class probable F420-dependent enzyme
MVGAEAERILRKRTIAHLALIGRKWPHVWPVWIDLDDRGRVILNTAEGRVKARLLQIGTRVGLAATDPDDPHRYVSVRGRVVERSHKGADAVIDRLAHKYLGVDVYPYRVANEQRVTVVVEPKKILVW